MQPFIGWKRELLIRRVLKKLSHQRVVGIVQPGNVWIIEKALITNQDEDTEAALRTCLMRGWIDVMEQNVHYGTTLPDGSLPNPLFHSIGPTWKLTDSGVVRIFVKLGGNVEVLFAGKFPFGRTCLLLVPLFSDVQRPD